MDVSTLPTKLFINNEWVDSVSGKTFETINPATEDVITSVSEADAADVDLAVAAARAAFNSYKDMNGSDRRDLLIKLSDLMARDRAALAEVESMDNGKPVHIADAADISLVRYSDVHFPFQPTPFSFDLFYVVAFSLAIKNRPCVFLCSYVL
jgi:delta 1-pyrroline-5-carboxylate dehydrogenase